MSGLDILFACLICLIVSAVSISMGGTSLITVPVLIFLGMSSKNAIATNMFALIFLSVGGAAGFRKEVRIFGRRRIIIFTILTICGSLIGANLILAINEDILRKIITVMICAIVGTFLFRKNLGVRQRKEKVSKIRLIAGALSIFTLGIYGGFFSGGYVALFELCPYTGPGSGFSSGGVCYENI